MIEVGHNLFKINSQISSNYPKNAKLQLKSVII